MAAVTELATRRGHAALLAELCVCVASFSLPAKAVRLICSGEDAIRGLRRHAHSCSGGTGSGSGASTRRTLPGSLASRCLCDVAR